jgi:hypothetical protein
VFAPAHHFSLVACVRCEIRAIDQHWSLHRLAVSLPEGQPDEALASYMAFAQALPVDMPGPAWPVLDLRAWAAFLEQALAADLADDLVAIRRRQEGYLRRELDRIDDYFTHYEQELAQRADRTRTDATRVKAADRLAAARAEHQRRRNDQLARHEIVVLPHLDAILLVAEPAWKTKLGFTSRHQSHESEHVLVPRSRRWHLA